MLHALDLRLLRLLRTHGHDPAIERVVVRFSRLGEHGMLWIAVSALGALLHPRRRRLYLRALRTVAATYVATQITKRVIRRARPLLEDLPALSPTLSQLSYPSAHASTSFAAARALSRALPGEPLYACAAVMALSRPYVGVHYPSDVAAGVVLGTAIAELTP